jgi:hypothetical protein
MAILKCVAMVLGLSRRGEVSQKRQYARPRLEFLEERVVPANDIWIGPPGGAFGIAANWSEGFVPGPMDSAEFDPGLGGTGNDCVINGTYAVSRLKEAVTFSGTLTFAPGSSLTANAEVITWGAVILGAGSTITTNAWDAYGPVTVPLGSTLVTVNAGTWTMQGGTLTVIGLGLLGTPPDLTVNGRLATFGVVTIGDGIVATNVLLTGSGGNSLASTTILNSGITLTDSTGLPLDFGGQITMLGATVGTTGGTNVTGTLITTSSFDTIIGTGSYALENAGGTITWQSTGFNTLNVIGNYTDFLGTLNERIAPALSGPLGSVSDILFVTGSVTFNQTIVNIAAPAGLGVNPSPFWPVGLTVWLWAPIVALGGIDGTIQSVNLPPPPPPLFWVTGVFTLGPGAPTSWQIGLSR